MPQPKKYVFSEEALQQARIILPMASEAELQNVVRKSARCTHPEGNRRFKNVVFKVAGKTVLGMAKYVAGVSTSKGKCDACGGTGKVLVYEGCDECTNSPCQQGGSTCKMKPVSITCQECSPRRR